MKTNCNNSGRRSHSRALTLVEAVAGTALLGTVLAGIVVAKARLTAATGRGEGHLHAVEIADELLGKWWDDRSTFPREDSGSVEGRDGWRWRTRIAENEQAEGLGAEIVALEIFRGISVQAAPAVHVEILLPKQAGQAEQ